MNKIANHVVSIPIQYIRPEDVYAVDETMIGFRIPRIEFWPMVDDEKNAPKLPGIYALWSGPITDLELLYIGRTKRLRSRVNKNHYMHGKWDFMSYLQLPMSMIDAAESVAISSYQPKMNRCGCSDLARREMSEPLPIGKIDLSRFSEAMRGVFQSYLDGAQKKYREIFAGLADRMLVLFLKETLGWGISAWGLRATPRQKYRQKPIEVVAVRCSFESKSRDDFYVQWPNGDGDFVSEKDFRERFEKIGDCDGES